MSDERPAAEEDDAEPKGRLDPADAAPRPRERQAAFGGERAGIAERTLAALLLLAHALLALAGIFQHSLTFDERSHLPAGMAAAATGEIVLNRQHPPLVKLLAGLAANSADPFLPLDGAAYRERREWDFGQEVLFASGNDPGSLLRRGRLPTLLLSLAGGLAVYLWSRALFGGPGGLLSLALWAFSPTILGHDGWVTMDAPLAAFSAGALALAWRTLARGGGPRQAALAGLLLGLALATKFSALVFAAALVPLFFWNIWGRRRKGKVPRYPADDFRRGSGDLSPYPLSAAERGRTQYGEGTPSSSPLQEQEGREGSREGSRPSPPSRRNGAKAGRGVAHSGSAEGEPEGGTPSPMGSPPLGNGEGAGGEVFTAPWRSRGHEILALVFFAAAALWACYLFPRDPLFYLRDLGLLYRDLKPDYLFYLAGDFARRFPHYFAATFALKSTPVELLLVPLAAFAVWHERRRSELLAFLAWPALLFFLATSALATNQGHRYLLPCYPLFFVLAGSVPAFLAPRLARAGLLIGILAAAQAFEAGWHQPDHLSYFNEFAGGKRSGPQWLDDSNVDWGQDLGRLPAWLEERGIRHVRGVFLGQVDPRVYGLSWEPVATSDLRDAPRPGAYVLSGHVLARLLLNAERQGWHSDWLLRYPPQDVLGGSLFLYVFPELPAGPAQLPAGESAAAGQDPARPPAP